MHGSSSNRGIHANILENAISRKGKPASWLFGMDPL
jgi:hypothetical protein